METWSDCNAVLQHGQNGRQTPLQGKVTWAIWVPGKILVMCDEVRSVVSLRKDDENMVDVPLAPLTTPVGAVFFDGLVYVACFGSYPQTTSGLAVVNPYTRKLVATYPFPPGTGVHNVYVFDWQGKPEIFIVNLGWLWGVKTPIPGKGLVRFDRDSKQFLTDTTAGDLNARSAVQYSDGTFFVLTQEAKPARSKLVRLEPKGSARTLEVTATEVLPARTVGAGGEVGDGGADVFLGLEPNTLWCTDRTGGPGKLYFFTFDKSTFHLAATRETGKNPRYTNIFSGDIVACNQDDATLSVFKDLASNPLSLHAGGTTVPTVPTVSFFIQEPK